MLWSSPRRRSPLALALASASGIVVLAVSAASAQTPGLCLPRGPIPAAQCGGQEVRPENTDNKLNLCSIAPAAIQTTILPDGLQLAFNAPPRETSTYVSAVTAVKWVGLNPGDVVPTITLEGAYLAFEDQRIRLDVLSIDSLGVALTDGFIGQDRIRIAWISEFASAAMGAVGGNLDLPVGYTGWPLRFDIPRSGSLPDTTALAGLRIRFRVNDPVHTPPTPTGETDAARFEVEDFEGWHIWRWGGDPTSCVYNAMGEYSKLAATDAPSTAWPGVVPSSRRITFVDRDVFNGFVYHYAVTTYDQGFRRNVGGDLALKFDSPVEPAHYDQGGQLVLGPTQVRIEFRQPPPATFEPVAAFPNPFRDAAIDGSRPESQKVTFVNVPPRGTLYIFTLAGDLVFQRDHSLPTIGTVDWDTRNQSGERVASGVFIYKIVDLVSGEHSYGRLAIIR
jgi:hypothetical protein